MGFTPKRKQYRLVFEDPDMAGLVVVATAPSMGMFADLVALGDIDMTDEVAIKSRIKDVNRIFDHFAESLVSWNLETDDKHPIPATREGLDTQEIPFVMDVIKAWTKATASVSVPLPEGSSYGGLAPVASIPMETLSPSLAS